MAGSEAGIRTEILAAITEVYRAEQNLPELVTLLEKEGAGDFQRLVVLGALYVAAGGPGRPALAYCTIFCVARMAHSYAYLAAKQPWRTVAFVAGLL